MRRLSHYRGWKNGEWNPKDHRCSFFFIDMGSGSWMVSPCETCASPIIEVLKFELSLLHPGESVRSP